MRVLPRDRISGSNGGKEGREDGYRIGKEESEKGGGIKRGRGNARHTDRLSCVSKRRTGSFRVRGFHL